MNDSQISSNVGIVKDAEYNSVLQTRLNTQPLIDGIVVYLTGKVQRVVYDQDKKPKLIEQVIASPKANQEGIQWLINYVSNIINPSVVQANFIKEEMFFWYVANARRTLAFVLMKNLYIWDIQQHDYEPIIETIMGVIYPFMTRPLANKERESYGGMRILESSTIEQKNKGFSLNPFNKGG
jgi:hypothetical protein